jgi:uncharacterized protein with ParB-like and HNH nuclease domain
MTINKAIRDIHNNRLFLPAIQREFVWSPDRICSLFDSIMRGYPIGLFLFWSVKKQDIHKYTFYKFTQDFDTKNPANEHAPKVIMNKMKGVIDGQQRLSSMYVALLGTYAFKRPYLPKKHPNAYPKHTLHLNILRELTPHEDKDYVYEFKFLTQEQSLEYDENTLWFPASDVLKWGHEPTAKIGNYYQNLKQNYLDDDGMLSAIKKSHRVIRSHLSNLHWRIVEDECINYCDIDERSLDNILHIFVRVNSGGVVLSKSGVLFSTLVAHWEEAREEIEGLLTDINGYGFDFDTDFIMRACLVLTDLPVLFQLESFKKKNIYSIKENWPEITKAMKLMAIILNGFGFSSETLTSHNAVIPIAYHLCKRGLHDSYSIKEMRKYLMNALLCQTYTGHGDKVLDEVRKALRRRTNDDYVLKRKEFSFEKLIEDVKLPEKRRMKVGEDDIEEILDYKKGPYTFMVLSLLPPQRKYGSIEFHQDHLHPRSGFTDAKLRRAGVAKSNWEDWQWMRDRLPNLQILEGPENERKSKTPLKEWVYGKNGKGNPDVDNPADFIKANQIPRNASLDIKDFGAFYDSRRKALRKKLTKVLL